MSVNALLEVTQLGVSFVVDGRPHRAIEDITFSVKAGQTLCIVGESGCGKSVTALALMGLLPRRGASIDSGSILFEGRDLLRMPELERRRIRGARMAMIFQEPMTSLNPAMTIGTQIAESLVRHRGLTRSAARLRAIELLKRVQIPDAPRRFDEYPHKLSGGMRQRVMIAIALACEPALLIADEPTTALDVTVQAQILELLSGLQRETGMALVLITHDLGIVGEVADHVLVMYAGAIVESAPAAALFEDAQHPYTIGLLGAIPSLDAPQSRLASIEGQVPPPEARGGGCSFASRCPFVIDRCRREVPPLLRLDHSHDAACWRAPLSESMALRPSAAEPASR
jgi:peptide/nickel transport system ATP-binding protein